MPGMVKPYQPRTAAAVSFHDAARKFKDGENKLIRAEKKALLVGSIFSFVFDACMELAVKIALHCVAWVVARSLSSEFTEKVEDGPRTKILQRQWQTSYWKHHMSQHIHPNNFHEQ